MTLIHTAGIGPEQVVKYDNGWSSGIASLHVLAETPPPPPPQYHRPLDRHTDEMSHKQWKKHNDYLDGKYYIGEDPSWKNSGRNDHVVSRLGAGPRSAAQVQQEIIRIEGPSTYEREWRRGLGDVVTR